jgi:hypothetical protein
MEFRVSCDCGKPHTVTAGDAGAKVACPCGRTVSVPSLSELRRGQGLAPYDAPLLEIERMLAANQLPPAGGCVRCGGGAERVAVVAAECARAPAQRRTVARYLLLAFAIMIPGVRTAVMRDLNASQPQYDAIAQLPLLLCDHCRAETRDKTAIKALLRHVPVYARLLDKYPSTRVTLP